MIVNNFYKCKAVKLIDVAIVLMIISIGFYYFNLMMISSKEGIDILGILEMNPITSLDIIAICGRMFSVLILIRLRKKIINNSEQRSCVITLLLLACSQLLVQNYLLGILLLYIAYRRYFPLYKKDFSICYFKENIPSVLVLFLHLFVLLISIRIQYLI